jgi:hypothetical protein
MAAKEVPSACEQLAYAPSAMPAINNAGASEIGALASIVAICVRDVDRLRDWPPFPAIQAHLVT